MILSLKDKLKGFVVSTSKDSNGNYKIEKLSDSAILRDRKIQNEYKKTAKFYKKIANMRKGNLSKRHVYIYFLYQSLISLKYFINPF